MPPSSKPSDSSPRLPLRIGCPVWNCDQWANTVYPAKTPRRQWLHWYTRMFNTVEGNSSFYAIPQIENVRRWCQEAAPGFQFCMKFPREVSHERALVRCDEAMRPFLEVLDILQAADLLGPTFLQLGPEFGPDRLGVLEAFLRDLPDDKPWAVEVRHLGWFDGENGKPGSNEQRIDGLLTELEIDKVLFDSRPLYQLPPDDEIERVSQTRKPKTPHRTTVTGMRPMVRLVGRNQIELVDRFSQEWYPTIVDWIQGGLQPIVFTHAPDDQFAPELARRFWDNLQPQLQSLSEHESIAIGNLPRLPQPPRQLDLFS